MNIYVHLWVSMDYEHICSLMGKHGLRKYTGTYE